jgi:hypothetical protein
VTEQVLVWIGALTVIEFAAVATIVIAGRIAGHVDRRRSRSRRTAPVLRQQA